MAESFELVSSNLFCTENTDSCFDDLDCNANDQTNLHRSDSLMGFPLQSEEMVGVLIERETEHLPRDDYLKRLRSGDLDLSVRNEALDWIWKAHAHYSFGPSSVCLSMNYLDRFLSVYELPKGRSWAVQLLAVACLSLAAKIEETKVPLCVDLQVGEPKFVFEGKTIQRMEFLVLSTLNWRMQPCTPFSFIDYFLGLINNCQNQNPSTTYISQSIQLILSTIRGIDFLEFRPSEIAAAVAISVSGEIISSLNTHHLEKERVEKCVEVMKGGVVAGKGSVSSSIIPESPNGVLDAICLSYKTDESTVGSCANSSQNNSQEITMKTEPI